MLKTLGVDGDQLILIIALVSIWVWPTVFVHLYAAQKLDRKGCGDEEVAINLGTQEPDEVEKEFVETHNRS